MLTPELHMLKSGLRRELLRLKARPFEGGPSCAARNGTLWVFRKESAENLPVTKAVLVSLAALSDGAGAEQAWQAIVDAQPLERKRLVGR